VSPLSFSYCKTHANFIIAVLVYFAHFSVFSQNLTHFPPFIDAFFFELHTMRNRFFLAVSFFAQ